ncbi:MAG: hypothetical protein Q7P63_10780 [Verrucomicrobiota bacterium JB022]|nr:hypothetical protein [Verrucomicrobiota bacterium JB022]
MKYGNAFFAGVVGALAFTLVVSLLRLIGLPLNLGLTVGTLFGFEPEVAFWPGFCIHLVAGGVFGLVYAAIFEYGSHRAGVGPGALIGAIHGVLSGLSMLAMPLIHPQMPDVLPAPGAFAINYGFWSAVVYFGMHVAFGAIVGHLYRPVLHTRLSGLRHLNPSQSS